MKKSLLAFRMFILLCIVIRKLYLLEELREYYEDYVLTDDEFDSWLDENYEASDVIDGCQDDYWDEFVDDSFNEWVEDYTTCYEKEIQITIK